MPHATSRLRVRDYLLLGAPQEVGIAENDLYEACRVLYRAQQRLIFARESGDSGWFGCWAEILFEVDPADPFITLPRGMSRIAWATVCNNPVPINNQLFEYLQFGSGRTPEPSELDTCGIPSSCICRSDSIQDKGVVATARPVPAGSLLRFYITDTADASTPRRALVGGTDNNDLPVSGIDSGVLVQGEMVLFASPFATTITSWNSVTGLQKDSTSGFIMVYAVDAGGNETLVASLEPSERVSAYRRYYLPTLPSACCGEAVQGGTVAVRALVKLDLLPLASDTDYLVIQNLEALNAEIQSLRLAGADGMSNKQESRERHEYAVSLLQGELTHHLGKDRPAVEVALFGHARLSKLSVNMQ